MLIYTETEQKTKRNPLFQIDKLAIQLMLICEIQKKFQRLVKIIIQLYFSLKYPKSKQSQ